MPAFQDERRMRDKKDSSNHPGLAGWMFNLMRSLHVEAKPVTKQLHLLETLALGGKRQLLLVSCGDEHFLVGGGIETVETIVQIQVEVSSGLSVKKLDGMNL
jgi:flagellar biogenesis protein FliO